MRPSDVQLLGPQGEQLFLPSPFRNAARPDGRFCYRGNGALVRTQSYEDAADRVV